MVHAGVAVFLCVILNVCAGVICPDGGICVDGNTCCQTPSGWYGCCPLPNAECCSDHIHCCYEGTLCDLEHSKCVNRTHVFDWVEKVATKQEAVVCPDQESECPDETTCCQMPDGNWGCCPMKNAVCCEDKQHCCPQGTTCDLKHSKCLSPTHGPNPLWKKFAARRRKASVKKAVDSPAEPKDVKDVICPDQFSTCPDDTTCCQLVNGSYGCCPMPKAVCCSDHLHCCPEGTTCDLPHDKCVSPNGITAMATKIPAFTSVKSRENVPCNETVACASGSTCCKTQEGIWGCCPLPKAVCCEDHAHCCPCDTVCNLAEGTCDDPADPSVSVPLLVKVPTFPIVSHSPNQKCDETSTCAGDATCCRLASGAWGCCPLPQAVCCEDHLHCCPSGSVCNLAASTCDGASDEGARFSVPLVRKITAVTPPSHNQNCDETSVCPSGTTCCRLKSGVWGCCPLPQAVCCADGEHWCPQGYKCDVTLNTCVQSGLPSMPWFSKQLASSVTQQPDASIPDHRHVCDAHTSCPRDDTCCYMKERGQWGCCPLPEAVCCKDGMHCCPSGYKCDEEKTTCAKAYHQIPWFKKQEAKVTQGSAVLLGDRDVKCDSATSCASGSTCCKLPTGEWACCPLIKAVCCEDHEHCCPQGYTCNLQSATCIKSSSAPSVSLTKIQAPSEEEVLCDSSSRCSNTQTCCRLSDSMWACCPYKEAVCCKDMKHCCPKGHKCDPDVKGCTKESVYNWWANSL
ncbi:Granulins Proepithelin [Triplophysa tibetana]|uniref:Granulins Proepithelin n=1 Tax=Triplophysa tibetana TaxID=1572043 RepID=A0A5A9N3A7_9TELE|nr:Granulins Proepithelin [Triplophysa tibetana]